MVTSESNITTTNETATTESSADSKHDLDKAESKDPNKLEIIKQIRKINPDGSYTIGYEAEDGTFKIESRDVLGNVKGTYGYIDENGEIKRVSYTANNATGLKTMPLDTASEETANVPRVNRTYSVSTTRRPTPRTNVQSIPRRRYPYSDRGNNNNNNNKLGHEVNSLNSEPTTTVVYATSLSTPKPVELVRPTLLPFGVKTDNEQFSRPVEIDHISKVAKNAHMDLKALDDRSGTNPRRQLPENENFETQQQIIYGQSAGDDNTHIYGNGPGDVSVRPLYTSTAAPRVPAAVLAARQRAVQLQNIINKSPTTTTERVYAKPPKRVETERKIEQSTEANSGPVVQIPANNDIHEVAEDERRYFKERPSYRPREYVRYVPTTVLPLADQRQEYRMPPPTGFHRPGPEEQFLRETTRASQRQAPPYPEDEQPLDYQQVRPSANGYQQQTYLNPYGVSPYRSSLYDFPDRPLTARDFERLLQLLIYRHSQVQQYQRGYGYPGINPYQTPNPSAYPPIGGVGGYYGAYQIPRPPYYNPYYDPRYENPAYSNPTSQRQYPPAQPNDPQAGYSQTQAPTTEPDQNGYYDNSQQRPQVPRRRMYGSRPPLPPMPPYNEADYASNTNQLGAGASDGYLPPNVREDLLYRMFMLALRSDPGSLPAASNIEPTTIAPVTSRKPVRSVQILGEEDA